MLPTLQGLEVSDMSGTKNLGCESCLWWVRTHHELVPSRLHQTHVSKNDVVRWLWFVYCFKQQSPGQTLLSLGSMQYSESLSVNRAAGTRWATMVGTLATDFKKRL